MRVSLDSLQPGKTYSIQVRGSSDEAVSEWSRTFTLTVTSAPLSPPDPQTPTLSVVGDSFLATWTYSGKTTDFSHYEVMWNNGTTDSVVQKVTGETTTLVFSDNVLFFNTPAPTVSIKVRAVRRSGAVSGWVQSSTASNPVPTQIPNVTATSNVNAVTVNWDAATFDDYEYSEVYAEVGNSTTTSTSRIARVRGTSYVHPTSSYASALWYKVKHFDKFNQPSATAGVSASAVAPTNPALVDVTPPAVPTSVTITNNTNDPADPSGATSFADVNWTAPTDADLAGYKVRWSLNGSSGWEYMDIPKAATTARIRGLRSGSSYYVQILAYDTFNNASTWVNAGTYPFTAAADSTAPSQPAAPTIATSTMNVQVTVSGNKQAGGAMEADVNHYEVYLYTTSGATLTNALMVGTLEAGPAIVGTFQVPASAGSGTSQTWYSKVVAVDNSGNRSIASPESSGSVLLIDAVNIGDAVITSAKIASLAASKITAGTISAQTITLGSAGKIVVSSTGTIESSNYTSTTGYRLTNTSFELIDGTISSKAVILQDPTNMVPAQFSNFDWAASSYPSGHLLTGTSINSYDDSYIGGVPGGSGAVMSIIADASAPTTSNHGAWLGVSATDYNIPVEANTTYTFSCYVAGYTGAGTFKLAYKNNSGVTTSSASINYPVMAGGFTSANRVSYTFTTGGSDSSILLGFNSMPANGIIWIGGFQLEKGSNATRYKMPGVTSIDGNSITSGSIKSSQTTTIGSNTLVPKWSINVAGDAMLNSAVLRGGIVLGVSGDSVNSNIQSADYVANTTGFKISYTGNAEFNNLVARGSLYAGTNSALTVDNNTGFTLTRELVYNLITNPSFESGATTNWTFSNTTQTVHSAGTGLTNVGGVAAGSTTLYVSGTASSAAYMQNTIDTTGHGGKNLWVSWYIYPWYVDNKMNYANCSIVENGGSGRTLTGSGMSPTVPVGTWGRLSVMFTLPSNWHTSTLVRVPTALYSSASVYSGTDACYIDAIMATATNEITEYFDGENGGLWSGTIHVSSSYKSAFNVIDFKIKSGGTSTLRAIDQIVIKPTHPMRSDPYIQAVGADASGVAFTQGIEISSGQNTRSPYRSAKLLLSTSWQSGFARLSNVDYIQLDVGSRIQWNSAAPATPSLSNWANYGGNWTTFSLVKELDGWFSLEGIIYKTTSTIAAGGSAGICTLPTAARPAADLNFPVLARVNNTFAATCFVEIIASTGVVTFYNTSGQVFGTGNAGAHWVSLHGVRWTTW